MTMDAMTNERAAEVLTAEVLPFLSRPWTKEALTLAIRGLTSPPAVPDAVRELAAHLRKGGWDLRAPQELADIIASALDKIVAPPSEPPSGGVSDATFEGMVAGVGSLPSGMGYAELEARHSPAEQGAREVPHWAVPAVEDSLRTLESHGYTDTTLAAVRDWLRENSLDFARPTDDKLWDKTLRDRDRYHEIADDLANGIAAHFGWEIGEHTSANCPWQNALDLIAELPEPLTAGRVGVAEQTMAHVRKLMDEIHAENDDPYIMHRLDQIIAALAGPLVAGEVEAVAWMYEGEEGYGRWLTYITETRPLPGAHVRNVRPLVYADTAKGNG